MADQKIGIVAQFKDEASSQMAKMGESIKGTFDKVSLASGVALAGLTAFAGSALNNFADLGEELSNLSAQTGISTENLSGMKVVADAMGLSIDNVTGSVKKMQVNLSNMAEDTKKADEALKPLGLTFKDIKDLKPEEQLFELGNKIAALEDPAQKTALAVQLFGKSGTELLPFFQEGNASLEEFVQKARDMGLAMDDVAANKALALDDAMDNLKGSIAGATQEIAVALAPAITALVEKLTPLLTQVASWIGKNPELTAQIAAWTAGILAAGAAISPLIGLVTALGNVLAFIAANPIVLVIAAIAAFIAVLVEAYNTSEDFRIIVNEVWANVQFAIGAAVDGITSGIRAGMEVAVAVWQAAWSTMENITSAIVGTIKGIVDGMVAAIRSAVETAKALFSSISNYASGVAQRASSGYSSPGSQFKAPGAANGGILTGSTSGYPAILHGTEAVVPLPDGRSIPVEMRGGGSVQMTFGDVHIAKEVDAQNFINRMKDELARTLQLKQVGSV